MATAKSNYDSQFIELGKFDNGGVLRVHEAVNPDKDPDYFQNFFIAWGKAKQGCLVDIMPNLPIKDERRIIIFHDGKPRKCPDLRIDGVLCEVEHPRKPGRLNTLKHRISDGAKQADYVIINLDKTIDINLMRRTSKGRFIDWPQLQCIEFRYKETSVYYRREDFNYTKKEPLH